MKRNLSNIDRVVRVTLAIMLMTLYFTGVITDTTGIILTSIGGVLLLTSGISFCPLYTLVGLNTYCSSCEVAKK